YQCGLPKEMALELFKPFVMKKLVSDGLCHNIKSAKRMVERVKPEVWDALEVVIKDHPVMLNRAPTLHRLGIQAFEPVLVEGRAIKLHPLVCTAFNADFDGDQMAVHVPLSAEAQSEARFLMLAANNLLKPSDGKPVVVPTQDMILGSYYLTLVKPDEIGNGKVFRNVDEAMMAYEEGDLGLHAPIKIRMTKEVDGKVYTELLDCTLGKVIFNAPVPQDLGFVDRSNPENMFKLEINELVNKKVLGRIIERCIRVHGTAKSSVVLDNIKAQGYKYSTRSGITVAVCDATIPEKKVQFLAETEALIDTIEEDYQMGFLSDQDRSRSKIKAWEICTKNVSAELRNAMDPYNPIFMMLDSGARGSDSQLRQLAGMRGLIANTAGKTIEIPIRANYREGLNIIEYFISSRGARKGLADTALRTADSGYLTRRLVDVSQEVIIREEDCHCHDGLEVYDIKDGNDVIEPLSERLTGRYLLENFCDENGEIVCDTDTMIDDILAKKIADMVNARPNAEDRKIKIRSLLTCESDHGVCIRCYGSNLATAGPVTVGEAVGIIAAQSIGEPGTQLTMRTFHTGGVASQADITQGLPRVEELFEGRKPKTLAMLSEIDGKVSFEDIKKSKYVVITGEDDVKKYLIPFDARLCQEIQEGARVVKGQHLTEGAVNPHDVLAVLGVDAVHNYLIKEVQMTYRMQGVDINDKHIEVIVRQMMRKLRIIDAGSTDLLQNVSYEYKEIADANAVVQARIDAGE
ncbi:MAG: DNA-directed RNA polymerase subunit beta', partial [Clostridia bacterium]|nr:DNA-directed RNA polymerase subunit beta' [Clostridia bacterium]